MYVVLFHNLVHLVFLCAYPSAPRLHALSPDGGSEPAVPVHPVAVIFPVLCISSSDVLLRHASLIPQSLVRIPETLVCAMEFITMPTPSEQTAGLEELRKLVLRNNSDLKDKNTFWKRKTSVTKV